MAYKTLSIKMAASLGWDRPQHGVTYHQQDYHGSVMYCGAAAAQMILESIDAGLINQEELFNSCKSCSANDPGMDWDTAPDGLVCTLNQRKPGSFPGSFRLWDLPSADAISRKLCWAIEHHGVAPILAVLGGRHWIVVVGYEATAAPTSSTDTSYQIIKFEVFDPAPPASAPQPPPPHGGDADHCGKGFFAGHDRGYQDKAIYYTEGISGFSQNQFWDENTMTTIDSGFWEGKYLAICDPDPAPDTQDPRRFFNDHLVLDRDEIRERATRAMDALGQNPRDPTNRALDGARAGEPLLVEREDHTPPLFYYLVPVSRAAGDVPMVMTIDAYESGGLAEFIAAPEGTTHFSYALDRDAVLRRFVGQEVEVAEGVVRLEEQDLYEHLVWQPSAESLSPYMPFYRFDVGGPDSGIRVYVRIDGEVFTQLRFGAGM